jgi:ribosomal protein L7/L12
MAGDDLIDHGRRIRELERQVAELYKRIGQEMPVQTEPVFGGTFASDAPASTAAVEDPRLVELLHAGNKIGAIKLYRELTGVGLAEAKDAVEGIERMN